MKRIDFLGASGIGKSTIFERLIERRKKFPEPSWLTRIEAKRQIAFGELVERRSPKSLAKAATCYLPRMGQVFVDAYTLRSAERAFANEPGEYGEFFEHCLHHLTGSRRSPASLTSTRANTGARATARHVARAPRPPGYEPPVARRAEPTVYVTLSWLFGRIKELCLLDSVPKTVVFDESLAHSTAGLLTDVSTDLAVRTHFEAMPVPDGLIHLTAPEDEILRRLEERREQRGASTVRHANVDDHQLRRRTQRLLRISQIGASTLQWRGVRLLSLDALDSPEKNARKVEAFIAE